MTAVEIIDTICDLLGSLREKAALIDSSVVTKDGIDFLMTRKEAAAFIGKSLRQFDRLRDKGRIATEVVDGELRFWRSHLLKFKGYSQVGPDPNKYRWYND